MALLEQIVVQFKVIKGQFDRAMGAVANTVSRVGNNIEDMGRVMGYSQKQMNTFAETGFKSGTMLGRFVQKLRRATQGSRGFKMELLGVMFFGMMLQRVFMRMLQPAMETFGLFELFSTMLLVLFLPIMPTVLELFMKLFNWIMELSPETKKLIGWLAILGFIIGTVLMVIGTFGLGIGSILKLIAFLGPSTASTGAAIAKVGMGISATFAVVIAAIITVIAFFYVMYIAIKENFMNIQANVAGFIEGIKQLFGGLIEVVKGIMELFNAILAGDLDLVIAALKRILQGVVDFLIGLGKYLFHGWSIVIKTFLRILNGIFNIVKEVFNRIIDWLDDKFFGGLLRKFFDWGKNIVLQIVAGIKSVISLVQDTLWKALGPFGKVIKSIGGGISSIFKGKKDDFIWRPNQGAVSINPNDTVVGFKGNPPSMGGKGVTLNTYNYINVSDKAEFERMLQEHDNKLLQDIRRNTA